MVLSGVGEDQTSICPLVKAKTLKLQNLMSSIQENIIIWSVMSWFIILWFLS